MSTLDRYLIRLTIPPFLLSLGLFTFALAVMPMLEYMRVFLSKGVPLPTVGVLLLLLLPASLSLTIPMAFLTATLMALGRLSGDRESVALLACGVSPIRLLRPLLVLGLLVAGLDFYVLYRAVPDANQLFGEIRFKLLTERTSAEIRPRVFFEQFPGKVLYVHDTLPDGRWAGVLLADTSQPGRPPSLTLAEFGRLTIDREQQIVRMELEGLHQYEPGRLDDRLYRVGSNQAVSLKIDAADIFGSGQSVPGIREMPYDQLQLEIERKRREGIPAHQEIIQVQQIFAFPVACLAFAVVGLALGLNTRQNGRLAGLPLGLGVILAYYALMALSEAWVKGLAKDGGPIDGPAIWARWIPDIAIALLGLFALWRQTKPAGNQIPVRLPAWLALSRAKASAGPGPVQAPLVVVRLPRLGLPVPRLLDRYIAGQFLRSASLAFVSLLALYYVGAFVDMSDKLFKGQAGLPVFLSFLVHSSPQFIAFIVPMAILVAALSTIGGLTRSGELIVMRACGVSLYRAAVPLLFCAALGSGLLFFLEERVLGEANKSAKVLQDAINSRPPRTLNVANRSWLVADDGRVYHYDLFEPATRQNAGRPTIHRLSVFETAQRPYRMVEHLYTTRASLAGDTWHAERGWVQRFAGDAATREDFRTRTLGLAPLEDFRRAAVDSGTMTWSELSAFVRRLGASGYNNAEQRVDLHRRAAFPLVTVVMALLAIPFGVTIGRKGALYGIGLATVLAGGYFLVMTVFVAIGAAGLLHPALAAWGANIIFGAGGLFLLFTVRT